MKFECDIKLKYPTPYVTQRTKNMTQNTLYWGSTKLLDMFVWLCDSQIWLESAFTHFFGFKSNFSENQEKNKKNHLRSFH